MTTKVPPEKLSDFMKDEGEIRIIGEADSHTATISFRNKDFRVVLGGSAFPLIQVNIEMLDSENFIPKVYAAVREGFMQGVRL